MDEEKKQSVSIILIFVAIVGLLESFFIYFGDYSTTCNYTSCSDKKLLVAVMDGSLPGSAGFAYVLNILLLLAVAVTSIVISTTYKRNGYVPRGLYFLAIIPGGIAVIVGIINLITYISLGASDVSSSYSDGEATASLGGMFAAIYGGNFVSGIMLIVGGIMGFSVDTYASRRRTYSASSSISAETSVTFRPYDVVEVMNHTSYIGENPLGVAPLGTYGIIYSNSPLTGEFFLPIESKEKYRVKTIQIIQRKNIKLIKNFIDYGRAKAYIREMKFGIVDRESANESSVVVEEAPLAIVPDSQKPTKKTHKEEPVKEASSEEAPKEEPKENEEHLTERERIALLREYKSLLDEGIITQEEFDDKKAEILGKKK